MTDDRAPTLAPPLMVDDVHIRHDGRTAWTPDGATFAVEPGQVVLLLGPSGAGKSTLALALNGLIPHAVPATLTGGVLVAGTATTDATVGQLSQHVAMVFQDPDAQIVTGTILDEVCFGPENLLLDVDDVLDRAERALRQVGLWERRTDNPDRLSGGGRQRLAIACALALGSPVIVLDEPTANLDPAGIDEVYAALADLVATGTRAIVLIEHNLDAAIDLVDRVLVLDHAGRPVLDGPARTVLPTQADRLVKLGVWLPVATLAAVRLRNAGVPLNPLPLTPRELARTLDRRPELPTLEPPTRPRPQPQGGPAVRVRSLTVTRGGRCILRNVHLDVGPGDVLAVIGTNGAGKTTLLHAIAGVAPPPPGQVQVVGLDPATTEARRLARTVGFVFQNPEHQFIRATVADEVAHGLEIQAVTAGEIADRVEQMLNQLGLAELRDIHPFLLSGGQKRRLSVATALITEAPILVLDEPTYGQDRERAVELLDLLAKLNADGTTVLLATHDMQLVADYATHVAVLADGALLEHDTADQVLHSDALNRAGLRPPPLAAAMRNLERHPSWRNITRLHDLPTPR